MKLQGSLPSTHPRGDIMAAEKTIDKELFERMPVPKAVRSFIVPSLLACLITIIYSIADTFFVGLTGDTQQVAGLTVAFPYYQFLQAFSSLWGVGANAVMAVALGRGDTARVSRASLYGFWGGVVFIVVIDAIFYLNLDPLLYAAGANAQTIAYAHGYMMWVFIIGSLPTLLQVVMANLLRAEGHAKAASTGLTIGGALNLVFDPLLIFGAGLGVAGAGAATLICNIIGFLILLGFYFKAKKTSYLTIRPFAHAFESACLKEIVLSGLPSCCLTLLGAIGCIVQTSLYSAHSNEAVAAWGVVNRMSFVGVTSTHAIAQGILPLVGYNFGAHNSKRVQDVTLYAFRVLMTICLAITVLTELFPGQIIWLFIHDAKTIQTGIPIMRIYMLCTPFMGTILGTSTLCQAIGKWPWSLGMLAVRQLVFNIPITFALERAFGLYGIPAGQPTCDFILFFIALFVYYMNFVKPMRDLDASEARTEGSDQGPDAPISDMDSTSSEV